MYEGSSQQPQPQIRFFMKNLYMKLGFPGMTICRERGSSQGTPNGS